MAHAPKADVQGIAAALERMTGERASAEQRVVELERAAEAQVNLDEAGALVKAREEIVRVEVRARTAESRLQSSESRAQSAESRAQSAVSRAKSAEGRSAAYEATIARLNDDVVKALERAGDQSELTAVKQSLAESVREHKATAAALDVAHGVLASLQAELTQARAASSVAASDQAQAVQTITDLQLEMEKLRAQPAVAPGATGPPATSLIAAVGPMLWGLEHSIKYLEQFADGDATLAGHVRQLQLLDKVLTRLTEKG